MYYCVLPNCDHADGRGAAYNRREITVADSKPVVMLTLAVIQIY